MKSRLFLLPLLTAFFLLMRKLIVILFVGLLQTASAQFNFHWRQYSGPLQTNIVNPDSANTLVTGLNQVGIYGYEFTLSDSSKTWESKDSMTVTVTDGVLSIKPDSAYHVTRPQIKDLEIKVFARTSDIFIQIKSPKQQQIECTISDMLGRRLAKIDLQVKKGTNYITAPKPRIAGIYILLFTTYFDETVVKKLLI